jgi:hypothetical protein
VPHDIAEALLIPPAKRSSAELRREVYEKTALWLYKPEQRVTLERSASSMFFGQAWQDLSWDDIWQAFIAYYLPKLIQRFRWRVNRDKIGMYFWTYLRLAYTQCAWDEIPNAGPIFHASIDATPQ